MTTLRCQGSPGSVGSSQAVRQLHQNCETDGSATALYAIIGLPGRRVRTAGVYTSDTLSADAISDSAAVRALRAGRGKAGLWGGGGVCCARYGHAVRGHGFPTLFTV